MLAPKRLRRKLLRFAMDAVHASSHECATALLLQLEQKSANQRFLESSLKELRAAREADQLKVTTERTKGIIEK